MIQVAIMAAILGTVGLVSVHQSTSEFRSVRLHRLTAVAENLVSAPIVVDRIGAPGATLFLAPEVARAVDLSGAGRAEFLAPDGRVLVSTDPNRQGQRHDVTSAAAVHGRGWSGDRVENGKRTIVAEVPVLSPSGAVLAVAAVNEQYPSTMAILAEAGQRLLLYLGFGAVLGLSGSWLLSRRISKQTHGLTVRQIATLAEHREALLHSIHEGVLALSDAGRINVLNDSAQVLLGLPAQQEGRMLDEVAVDPSVREFLISGPLDSDMVIATSQKVLVMNRRTARSQGRSIGSVTTMRDSTELASLQSQLSSHRSVTDTLRAQTHEFANQLHTIAGLIHLGEYRSVTEFVGTLTRRRAEVAAAVTTYVADPSVAALLIAKTSLAAESSVALMIDSASSLPRLDAALATDVITIVGNLVDNAVAACEGVPHAEVVVRIEAGTNDLHITVEDSGPGVPEHLRGEIFARGVTSNVSAPGGRGIGLALVRVVTGQRGGTATVSDSDGGGAAFRVHLPYAPTDLPPTPAPPE